MTKVFKFLFSDQVFTDMEVVSLNAAHL